MRQICMNEAVEALRGLTTVDFRPAQVVPSKRAVRRTRAAFERNPLIPPIATPEARDGYIPKQLQFAVDDERVRAIEMAAKCGRAVASGGVVYIKGPCLDARRRQTSRAVLRLQRQLRLQLFQR